MKGPQIRIGIVLESASRCGACPRILTAEQIGGNSDWCGAFGQPIHPVSPTSYIRLPECVAAEEALVKEKKIAVENKGLF